MMTSTPTISSSSSSMTSNSGSKRWFCQGDLMIRTLVWLMVLVCFSNGFHHHNHHQPQKQDTLAGTTTCMWSHPSRVWSGFQNQTISSRSRTTSGGVTPLKYQQGDGVAQQQLTYHIRGPSNDTTSATTATATAEFTNNAPEGTTPMTTMTTTASTFYDILDVSKKATPKELKSAFLRLAKQTHPDANLYNDAHLNDSQQQPMFGEVVEAYKILSDPKQRIRYDRSLTATAFTQDVENFMERHVAPSLNNFLENVAGGREPQEPSQSSSNQRIAFDPNRPLIITPPPSTTTETATTTSNVKKHNSGSEHSQTSRNEARTNEKEKRSHDTTQTPNNNPIGPTKWTSIFGHKKTTKAATKTESKKTTGTTKDIPLWSQLQRSAFGTIDMAKNVKTQLDTASNKRAHLFNDYYNHKILHSENITSQEAVEFLHFWNITMQTNTTAEDAAKSKTNHPAETKKRNSKQGQGVRLSIVDRLVWRNSIQQNIRDLQKAEEAVTTHAIQINQAHSNLVHQRRAYQQAKTSLLHARHAEEMTKQKLVKARQRVQTSKLNLSDAARTLSDAERSSKQLSEERSRLFHHLKKKQETVRKSLRRIKEEEELNCMPKTQTQPQSQPQLQHQQLVVEPDRIDTAQNNNNHHNNSSHYEGKKIRNNETNAVTPNETIRNQQHHDDGDGMKKKKNRHENPTLATAEQLQQLRQEEMLLNKQYYELLEEATLMMATAQRMKNRACQIYQEVE